MSVCCPYKKLCTCFANSLVNCQLEYIIKFQQCFAIFDNEGSHPSKCVHKLIMNSIFMTVGAYCNTTVISPSSASFPMDFCVGSMGQLASTQPGYTLNPYPLRHYVPSPPLHIHPTCSSTHLMTCPYHFSVLSCTFLDMSHTCIAPLILSFLSCPSLLHYTSISTS